MTTIVPIAAIQEDARHAAGQGRDVNPWPTEHPANEIWQDAYDAARLQTQPTQPEECTA